MPKNIFNVSIVMMSFFATNVFASNDECKLETTVAGTVDTINVSPSLQVGTIHLKLFKDNGAVMFEEDGGIIGIVTSQNGTGGSTLDHDITFADGSKIETTRDTAQITGVNGDPTCSFTVAEEINNFWGTERFKRATGKIYAIGTISFCEGENSNHFVLSGTVCLK